MPEQESQLPSDPANIPILQSVDKVIGYWKLFPGTVAKSELYGVITRVTDIGHFVFVVLNDGTGSIQLIAKREDFSEDDWKQIKSQKEKARVRIVGLVGESERKRISILLSEVPSQLEELRSKGRSFSWPDIRIVSRQVLLSNIRRHCVSFLAENKFLEIEPFFISRSWQGDGLHPLEVQYPGFGMPVFLVPSPAPQILKAIITTGNPRIFSVSRCFTGEFRDTMDRTEAVLICARIYPASWEELKTIAVNGIKSVLAQLQLTPAQERILKGEWVEKATTWPPDLTNMTWQEEVAIELFAPIRGGNKLFGDGEVQIFRICWRHERSNVYICDGLIESYEDGFKVGTINWHADRMVYILENTVHRQLLSLDYWTAAPVKK